MPERVIIISWKVFALLLPLHKSLSSRKKYQFEMVSTILRKEYVTIDMD